MVFEFVSWADYGCVLHHFSSLTRLKGSWGQVWPKTGQNFNLYFSFLLRPLVSLGFYLSAPVGAAPFFTGTRLDRPRVPEFHVVFVGSQAFSYGYRLVFGRFQWELQDWSLSPVSGLGPEIVDFGGLNGPLLPQNPLEKVGGFPPHLFQCVLR